MGEPNSTPVLCAGYVNWDIVLHTDTVPEPDFSCDIEADHTSCGGSATNTAMALTGFGQPVSLFGGIGADESGVRVTEKLNTVGVQPELVVGGSTTVIYAMITPGDDPRYFARYGGAVSDFEPTEVSDDAWNRAGHVHVTSFSQTVSEGLAERAASDGKTVSFNPSQGYGNQTFPGVVDSADVIFLNEREKAIFCDRYDFDEVVDSGTVVVVTHGADGSTAHTPEGIVTHPGYSVPGSDVVDTIGAGDCFVAGFLSDWTSGRTIREALARGNAAGAFAVTQVGAPDAIDSEWVEELLNSETVFAD